MPFLTNIMIGKKKNKLNLNFGPNISYLFSKSIIYKENSEQNILPENIENKYDFGLNFGVAYGRLIKDNLFEFEIRYNHGLFNIYKTNEINNSVVSQNQTIEASISYLLKFGKKNKHAQNN